MNLSQFLLTKDYIVHGISNRMNNKEQISGSDNKITLHYGDMTDSANLIRLIKEIQVKAKLLNFIDFSTFNSPYFYEFKSSFSFLYSLKVKQIVLIR